MVRHWEGSWTTRERRRSSSSGDHSVFLMDGSSHSCHRALACLALFLPSSDATRPHWWNPNLVTAAFKISSSAFVHWPPFAVIFPIPFFFPHPSILCFFRKTVFFIWKKNSIYYLRYNMEKESIESINHSAKVSAI